MTRSVGGQGRAVEAAVVVQPAEQQTGGSGQGAGDRPTIASVVSRTHWCRGVFGTCGIPPFEDAYVAGDRSAWIF
jgi:hypothetical protein